MTDIDRQEKITQDTTFLSEKNGQEWFKALAILPGIIWIGGNLILLNQCLMQPHFPLGMVGIIYNFNTLAIPIIFFCFGFIIMIFARRKIHSRILLRTGIGMIGLAILFSGVRLYATHIEPYRMILRQVTIQTPKLDRPLTILHISDIQSEAIGNYEEKVFAQIRELNPDLIVHTGDLLQPFPPTTWDSEFPKIEALFNTLSPPLGIFNVLGNTDVYQTEYFEQGVGKMKVLQSQNVILPWGDRRIQLYGMTLEQSWRTDPESIQQWLQQTDPQDFTILMGHTPDYILAINDLPIDLCLAGHTHGGQIRIPFIGPLTVLSAIPRAWGRGYRPVGNTHLNVSAGIGCEHYNGIPPIRFFCPPEMTLFRIEPINS